MPQTRDSGPYMVIGYPNSDFPKILQITGRFLFYFQRDLLKDGAYLLFLKTHRMPNRYSRKIGRLRATSSWNIWAAALGVTFCGYILDYMGTAEIQIGVLDSVR